MEKQFLFLAFVHVTYNLGSLSSWLTAIGTIASVIVSLFFGLHRVKKPNIGFELRKEMFNNPNFQKNPVMRLYAKNFSSQYVSLKGIKNKNTDFLEFKGTTFDEISLSPIESKGNKYINYLNVKFSNRAAKIKFKDLVSRRCITVYFLKKNNVWRIVPSFKYIIFKVKSMCK